MNRTNDRKGPTTMPETELKLNRSTATSLITYAAGLMEACKTAKITADPVEVLEESDRFPRLAKIETAEWIIGWFHGVAEAHGITVPTLWAEALRIAEAMPPKRAGKAGRKAA